MLLAAYCHKPSTIQQWYEIARSDVPAKPYESRSTCGQELKSTVELLEMILAELPSKDILLLRRVNKKFKSVIATSPLLRQKLVLTSGPTCLPFHEVELNPVIADPWILPSLPIHVGVLNQEDGRSLLLRAQLNGRCKRSESPMLSDTT